MRIRNLYVYAFALGLMISMTALSASATFSNASLKGGYGVLVNRWTANQNENETALVGVMTFDGTGNVTISFTSMSGGIEQTGNGSGTYSVNGDGTGTITFTTGSNPPEYSIVVNSSKSGLAGGLSLVRIDSNYPSDSVESGTAVLQSSTAVTYGLGKLKGSLTFKLDKWNANPNGNQEGNVSQVTANGAGGIKGSVTDWSAGTLHTFTFTGTYTVNSDGSGAMVLSTSNGDTLHISFVLNTVTSTGPAKGLQFLQTDNTGNVVYSGVALKQ